MKLAQFFLLVSVALALGACNSTSASDARQPTQTPWIIFMPVTTTPEPATFTPIPPGTEPRPAATLPRSATTARPAPTRTLTSAPIVAAPTATPSPECNIGTVRLTFPELLTSRLTKLKSAGGSAFEFKWDSPIVGPTDPKIGYRIDIESRASGSNSVVNGAVRMLSHNKSEENARLDNGKRFIFFREEVKRLSNGDNVAVFWKVTIVKAVTNFDDQGYQAVQAINCGPASETRTIQLVIDD